MALFGRLNVYLANCSVSPMVAVDVRCKKKTINLLPVKKKPTVLIPSTYPFRTRVFKSAVRLSFVFRIRPSLSNSNYDA